MENEEKFEPNHYHQVIYKYIYRYDKCSKRELNKALVHRTIDGNWERKEMSHKQLKRYLDDLIRYGHIICLDERIYNRETTPDIFTVNMDVINHYPDIKDKIRFERQFYTVEEAKQIIEEGKEDREISQVFQLYEAILANSISHEIIKNPKSKSKPFSSLTIQEILKGG